MSGHIIISKNLQETAKIAQDFVASLSKGDGATIVCLKGDLGAGKTAFTKSVAQILGVMDIVTSPTFVIEKIYELPKPLRSPFSFLIHIDAYRLERSEELLHLGWEETIQNSENLILLEWPERILNIIPKAVKTISFKFIDDTTREITL